MSAIRFALLGALLAASSASAAGFASNDNFVVYTPDQNSQHDEQRYAELVLDRADTFRKEFAARWLGEELPDGAGESVIYVDFSATEDRGLTWAKDHPDRIFHNIYLTTSPELATGCTLRHEIVHTVLATRYPHPHRLPEWVEEGIASRFDDESRRSAREQLLRHWAQTGVVPDIAILLELPDIKSLDESAYAAATSLVSFLLTKGDERTILRFAEDGQRNGWAIALQAHYGIRTAHDLQAEWQTWLKHNFKST
jgi:hypothetical protein